jgi:hypothetical protein
LSKVNPRYITSVDSWVVSLKRTSSLSPL